MRGLCVPLDIAPPRELGAALWALVPTGAGKVGRKVLAVPAWKEREVTEAKNI